MKPTRIPNFLAISFLLIAPTLIQAQSAVVGDIGDAVSKMSRIVLAIITGCGVWAGLKLAKGDQDAIPRLVMCIAGAVTVGVAVALINFFKV